MPASSHTYAQRELSVINEEWGRVSMAWLIDGLLSMLKQVGSEWRIYSNPTQGRPWKTMVRGSPPWGQKLRKYSAVVLITWKEREPDTSVLISQSLTGRQLVRNNE